MKRFFAYAIFVSLFATSATATMVRVVDVTDARTLVVDDAGRRSTVHLAGIELAEDDAAPAAAYLRGLTFGTWVLVDDNAFVYRSPDGLYINAEMSRHAWRASSAMKYLGESGQGARTSSHAAPATRTHAMPRLSPRPHKRPTGLKGPNPWNASAGHSSRHKRRT